MSIQDNLVLTQRPQLRSPRLVAAFRGWPDAATSASRAVSFLQGQLKAAKFAALIPDAFVDLTAQRPNVAIQEGLVEELTMPVNELYWWHNRRGDHDLVLMLGTEPTLRWQSYVDLVLDLAQSLDVSRLYTLGSLYDQVPHTSPTPISAVVSHPELRTDLLTAQIALSDYQGPSSIHSLIVTECRSRGLQAVSLWAHASNYVQVEWNAKATYALVRHLSAVLGLKLQLHELSSAADYLEAALDRLIAQDPEVQRHIEKIKEEFAQQNPGSLPSATPTEQIFDEIRDFLRRSEKDGEGD